MIRSTLGFIFTSNFEHVLLIKKSKPIGHKGKLNGLGGKCEFKEKFLDCMIREVKEESDLTISASNWKRVGNMAWKEWNVEIFTAVYQGKSTDIKSLTEDAVQWYAVEKLPSNIITNLSWLVPLSIDCLKNHIPPVAKIKYID